MPSDSLCLQELFLVVRVTGVPSPMACARSVHGIARITPRTWGNREIEKVVQRDCSNFLLAALLLLATSSWRVITTSDNLKYTNRISTLQPPFSLANSCHYIHINNKTLEYYWQCQYWVLVNENTALNVGLWTLVWTCSILATEPLL